MFLSTGIRVSLLFMVLATVTFEGNTSYASKFKFNDKFKDPTSLKDATITNKSNSVTTPDSKNRTMLLKQLIDQDTDINKSWEIAWSCTKQFLRSGDLDIGQKAISLSEQCIERRRHWIQYLLLSNKMILNGMPLNITLFKTRVKRLNGDEDLMIVIRAIYSLAVYEKVKEEVKLHCKNLTDIYFETRDYHTGVEAFNSIKEFINNNKLVSRYVEELWKRSNLSEILYFSWVRSFLSVQQREAEITSLIQYFQEDRLSSDLKVETIFRNYIDIIVYMLILVTGLVWNGVLLLIFVKHKKIRTTANIIVFNLAVTDTLNVIINVPFFYIYTYYKKEVLLNELECETYYMLRLVFIYVTGFLVVVLSAQRYIATHPLFKQRCHLSTLSITVLYTVIVWALAIAMIIAYSSVVHPRRGYCNRQTPYSNIDHETAKYVELFYLIIFCFLLPSLMAVFTVLTARRLKKNIPGEVRCRHQETARSRSANVITALAVTFAFSNIPRSLWFFSTIWFRPDMSRLTYLCVDRITYYLRFSNACFNPIAIYIASGTFRCLFKRYLFHCPIGDNQRFSANTTPTSSTVAARFENRKTSNTSNIVPAPVGLDPES